MTSYTGTHKRPTFKRGDTIGGMSLTIREKITTNPIVPASVLARLYRVGKVVYTFTSVINAITGEVIIEPIPATISRTLKAGEYFYDVEYTLADGRVATYLDGTLNIEGDFSNDTVG